jgi:hypothetical protein
LIVTVLVAIVRIVQLAVLIVIARLVHRVAHEVMTVIVSVVRLEVLIVIVRLVRDVMTGPTLAPTHNADQMM